MATFGWLLFYSKKRLPGRGVIELPFFYLSVTCQKCYSRITFFVTHSLKVCLNPFDKNRGEFGHEIILAFHRAVTIAA